MAKTKRKIKKPVSRTKLMSAHHTGKLRPHHHTSYGSLLIVLLLTFLPLLFIGTKVSADQSDQVYAVVPAQIPKTAPIITSPSNGRGFNTSDPVNLSGTCPNGTLIKVFKNGVMAGATLCQGGVFSIDISLFVGSNSVIVSAYNANDIAGPDSIPLTLTLQPTGVNFGGDQFLNATQPPAGQLYLTTEVYYRGASQNESITWPLTVAGGQAPYAISIGWGDGKTDLISRPTAGVFNISHTYAKGSSSGSYTIIIKSSDQAGNTSFLQLLAIVGNKNPTAGLFSKVSGGSSGLLSLQIAWKLMAFAVLAVLCFWLGEKRELYTINHKARVA
jgi:hypothetical protein